MTFEQKLADFLTAAAAMSESPLVRFLVALALIVGVVRLVAQIGRSDRGTTTYWYRGQQITRHDCAAIKAERVVRR
jgi:hypothetical protein